MADSNLPVQGAGYGPAASEEPTRRSASWRTSRPTSRAPCGRSRSRSATQIEEGDTVVVLESMKMEMPVEAEDEGTVAEIRCAGGPGRLRGRHARRARVVPDLAGGKLRLDEPAPHVARLTLDNPAKRNALDHDILDALAELLPRLEARCLIVTGEGPSSAPATTSARSPQTSSPRRRRRSSPTRSPPPSRRSTPSRSPCSPRSTATPSAAAWSSRSRATCASAAPPRSSACRPARLGLIYSHTGLRKFLDAIGAPRTRELFFTARSDHARPRRSHWGLVGEVAARRRRRRPRASSSPPRSRPTRRSRSPATSA